MVIHHYEQKVVILIQYVHSAHTVTYCTSQAHTVSATGPSAKVPLPEVVGLVGTGSQEQVSSMAVSMSRYANVRTPPQA